MNCSKKGINLTSNSFDAFFSDFLRLVSLDLYVRDLKEPVIKIQSHILRVNEGKICHFLLKYINVCDQNF